MKRFVAIVLAVGALTSTALAFATGRNPLGLHNGIVTACVEHGSLKVSGCSARSRRLSWGIRGPVGPRGPGRMSGTPGTPGAVGATGTRGDTGPKGQTGATGSTGATGASGPQGPAGPAGSVGPAGPAGSVGATGSQGPQGVQGIPGQQGDRGPSDVYAVNSPTQINVYGGSGPVSVAQLSLPAGSFLIYAKVTLLNFNDPSSEIDCTLTAGADVDTSSVRLENTISGNPAANTTTIPLLLPHEFTTAGTASLDCSGQYGATYATNARIAAIETALIH